MRCDKCNEEAVKNTANNKDFWYCRKCKEEVLQTPVDDDMLFFDQDDFVDYLHSFWTDSNEKDKK